MFLSVDPLVAKTGEPYIYAGGNPSTLSDPGGLMPSRACPDGGCSPKPHPVVVVPDAVKSTYTAQEAVDASVLFIQTVLGGDVLYSGGNSLTIPASALGLDAGRRPDIVYQAANGDIVVVEVKAGRSPMTRLSDEVRKDIASVLLGVKVGEFGTVARAEWHFWPGTTRAVALESPQVALAATVGTVYLHVGSGLGPPTRVPVVVTIPEEAYDRVRQVVGNATSTVLDGVASGGTLEPAIAMGFAVAAAMYFSGSMGGGMRLRQ